MNRLIGALAAVLVALSAPLANAAIQISYSVNGGPPVVCGTNPVSSGPVVCAAVSAAPVTISLISASSNSPGTPALAQEFGSTLVIQSSAAATLDLYIASQDFVAPTAPPDITFASSIST